MGQTDLRHGSQSAGLFFRYAIGAQRKLYEAIFDGVLSKLDLFSRYADAEGARRNRARRDGFGGIGVQFRIKGRELYITAVTPGMPAALSGIQANDIVTHIDGKPVTDLTIRQVTSQVRGPTHTTVNLIVTRAGAEGPQEHNLMRTHIVPTTVTEKRLGDVLYFKISSFNQDTSRSLADKLESAIGTSGNRLKGVILDVRGNPGGLLKQSIKAADLFLTQGNIVSTKGRHADSFHVYEAGGRDVTGGLPLLLLIDGKSASAAEIVAVALQDRERAVLIGTSSYGKGTVQTVLRLPNDGEITLTWSRLVAPSGYTLHGLGVRPELCTGNKAANISQLVSSLLETKLAAKAIFNQWRTAGVQDADHRRQLRDSCPAEPSHSDFELEVARHLIAHPAVYAQALTLSTEPHQAHK
ncbi:MAG: PDZ domain-containing protein [Rhodospirillales bacterium]|nr:PDZ domain-containing protein [Rhodospirillales bacterium]